MDKNLSVTESHCLTGAVQILLLALLAVATPLHAQNLYGSITGRVSDQSGAAIAGAKIVVTSADQNSSRETSSGQSGDYNLPNLVPGRYTVQMKMSGFQTFQLVGISVSLGSATRVDAHLLIGGATQQVVVTASAATLQTEESDVRDKISTRTLENLPTPIGRNFEAQLALIPGTVVTGGGAARGSNPAAAFSIKANGVPAELNNIRIDGASAFNNFIQGETAYVPGLDAIQSVDVVSNSSGAGTGLAGGDSINVQIKSGTNHLHGELFETNSNNAVEAHPALFPAGQKLPLMIYNQFGGTVGGPIIKDKLFYFLSYDGVLSRQAYSGYATVPTDAAKAGDFSSESPSPIYDPTTGNPDGTGRTAFLGNKIPSGRISDISKKILSLWPEPNQPGLTNNYFASASAPYDRHTVDGKISYNPTSKLSLSGHVGYLNWSEYYETYFGTALGGPSIAGQQSGPANGYTINLTAAATYVFTPKLILDGYFGYNNSFENVLPQDYGKNIGTDFLGIPGTNGPNIVSSGWPLISLPGYTIIGVDEPYMPWIRHDPGFDYVANFNWSKNTHNIRFGAEFTRRDLNHIQPEIEGQIGGAAGGFVFNGGVTQLNGGPAENQDNVFAAFLLGLTQEMGTTLQVSAQSQLRSNFYGAYLQDRWAIRPGLVFNYGVRWEYLPLPGRPGRGPEWYDATTNTQYICGYGPLVPRSCGIEMSKLGFSPHIGIAYSLTNTLVLRVGYGIARDPYDIGPRGLRVNYPDMIGENYQGANTYTPYEDWALGIPPIIPPNLGNGILPVPSSTVVHTIPREFHRGYIQSGNFTIEKQFQRNLMLAASYVRTLDVHQIMENDLNAGQIPGAGIAGENLYALFGRTATTPEYAPIGTMNYNALQVRFHRYFANGFSLGAGYAWSKAIGNSSDVESYPLVEATAYFKKNYAVLSYDRTHIVTATGEWELPFGAGRHWATSGFASKLLGGWQINGIFTGMTGLPFTVTASGTSLNMPGSTQFADQVAPVKILGGHGPGHPWFTTSSFAPVTQARFGTANPYSVRGPNLLNLDANIFRDIPLHERLHFQFRATSFNVTNTPHWALPGASVASPGSFGIITSTDASYLGRSGTDQRFFRFEGKLIF